MAGITDPGYNDGVHTNQHAIAVAVEAIPFADRFGIGA